MMKNYAESAKINHYRYWSNIYDHPNKILIIGAPGWGKTDVLCNLIKHQQQNVDQICLYVRGPFKCWLLINGRKK